MLKNDLFNQPFQSSVEDLRKSINEFKNLYPGYITQEYERAYLKNFQNYLRSLDQLSQDVAVEVAECGIQFANYLIENVKSGEMGSSLLFTFSKYDDRFPDEIISNKVLRVALNAKDPPRFLNDPATPVEINKKIRKHWYEFVQMNKHQLAKNYVLRDFRKFTKDEVLYKYHLEREKGVGVEKALQNTLDWLKSYGKINGKIYEEIGIQINDKDSFNKEYNRWKKKLGTELS